MLKLQLFIFPASSVAVTFMALLPIGSSCPDWLLDRTRITAFGSTWTELSVTLMLHITVDVGFPLSVLVSMIGPGQLKVGGSISTRRFYTKNVRINFRIRDTRKRYFFLTRLWKFRSLSKSLQTRECFSECMRIREPRRSLTSDQPALICMIESTHNILDSRVKKDLNMNVTVVETYSFVVWLEASK